MLLLLLFVANIATAQELQCHVQGECSGLYNGLTAEESYNDCLNTCKNSNTCNWFTYFDDSKACFEYVDCLPLETTCADCISGQAECSPEEAVCGAPGFCDGHVVAFNTTSTASDCLQLCQKYEECKWYSYYEETQFCVLTEDCLFIDESCTDCMAGERECYSKSSFGKLLVVGGSPSSANYKVEVVDLMNENKSCPVIADYPGEERGSVGTFIDNQATVCGGYSPEIDRCYHYNAINNVWTQTVSMTQPRMYAAGVQMSSTEWWISGGGPSQDYNSTEIYNVDNNNFTRYVELPEKKCLHTMVKINETHFLLVGDGFGSNKAWMFDRSTESWRPLPNMLQSRDSPFAGLVTYPDGHQEVVVAGGYLLKSSEILDLEQLTWRYGPDLPVILYSGVSVPYGNSFLLVGGYSEQKTIYSFDANTADWAELPQKLQNGRNSFAAFLVPDDFLQCN